MTYSQTCVCLFVCANENNPSASGYLWLRPHMNAKTHAMYVCVCACLGLSATQQIEAIGQPPECPFVNNLFADFEEYFGSTFCSRYSRRFMITLTLILGQ